MNRHANGHFIKGSGGRKPGSRNKLQARVIQDLLKDFEQHGEDVIKIVRLEKPDVYLKIIASVRPKEFVVADSAIDDMTEEELMQTLHELRKVRQVALIEQ